MNSQSGTDTDTGDCTYPRSVGEMGGGGVFLGRWEGTYTV